MCNPDHKNKILIIEEYANGTTVGGKHGFMWTLRPRLRLHFYTNGMSRIKKTIIISMRDYMTAGPYIKISSLSKDRNDIYFSDKNTDAVPYRHIHAHNTGFNSVLFRAIKFISPIYSARIFEIRYCYACIVIM